MRFTVFHEINQMQVTKMSTRYGGVVIVTEGVVL